MRAITGCPVPKRRGVSEDCGRATNSAHDGCTAQPSAPISTAGTGEFVRGRVDQYGDSASRSCEQQSSGVEGWTNPELRESLLELACYQGGGFHSSNLCCGKGQPSLRRT